MIGIIGAMPVEVRDLLSELDCAERRAISGREFYRGSLRGQDVLVVQGGVGKVNAALAAEAMILTWHPSLILNVGVGGIFTPNLGIGDVAVARDFVQYDVDTSALGDPVGFVSTVKRIDFPCHPWVVRQLLEAGAQYPEFRCRAVRIASGDRFCDGPADKRLLVDTFQAEVSDMEGCAIAQVCHVNGIPCAAARGISDAGDDVHGEEYGRYRNLAAHRAAQVLLCFLERLEAEQL